MATLAFSLTPRDQAILDALTLRVRVLSLSQIARTWWGDTQGPESLARTRLKELEREGLVTLFPLVAHPEIPLDAPLIAWRPGDTPPDFGEASHRAKRRWTRDVTTCAGVFATTVAGNWFGGTGGRPPRASEATHDLHLAAVFLRLREANPSAAATWTSEGRLLARGEGRGDKLPDAIVGTRAGGKRVIEFGGAYSKSKFAQFHDFCLRRKLPYEVW